MLSKEKLQEIKDSIPENISAIYYLFITLLIIALFSGVLKVLLLSIWPVVSSMPLFFKTLFAVVKFLFSWFLIVPILATAFTLKKNWHPIVLSIVGGLLIIGGVIAMLTATPETIKTAFSFFKKKRIIPIYNKDLPHSYGAVLPLVVLGLFIK